MSAADDGNAPVAPALVIFLHGLGDCGASWSTLASQLGLGGAKYKSVEWAFPDAPNAPVSCNNGFVMPSWFDLAEIPVEASSPDAEADLLRSADALCARADAEAAKRGLPLNRVFLGGFSQGAVVSMLAALRHKGGADGARLGGCVMLSGWAPLRGKLKAQAEAAGLGAGGGTQVPLFYGHGRADQTVAFALAEESAHCVRDTGAFDVTFKTYPGLGHGAAPQEFRDLAAWLRDRLRGPA